MGPRHAHSCRGRRSEHQLVLDGTVMWVMCQTQDVLCLKDGRVHTVAPSRQRGQTRFQTSFQIPDSRPTHAHTDSGHLILQWHRPDAPLAQVQMPSSQQAFTGSVMTQPHGQPSWCCLIHPWPHSPGTHCHPCHWMASLRHPCAILSCLRAHGGGGGGGGGG